MVAVLVRIGHIRDAETLTATSTISKLLPATRRFLELPMTAVRDYGLRHAALRGRGRYAAYPLTRTSEPDRSSLSLNKLCELEDWHHPERVAWMRTLLPYFLDIDPRFPDNMQHRKHWEFAQLMCGLERLGVLSPDSLVLSVGAGHEEPLYALTNHVRWVFATDIYGSGTFRLGEGDSRMLVDPDAFARLPYKRTRLIVQWMNGLDLRYEADTFDACFSMSSIEHFGGYSAARTALEQMARVAKPGGIVVVTTECIVNDAPYYDGRGLALFTPRQIEDLSTAVPDLALVEPLDLHMGRASLSKVKLVADAVIEARRGYTDYPAVVMEHKGREYTSVSLIFRKTEG